MFSWLKRERHPHGLEKIVTEFENILDAGHHATRVASDALFGATDPEAIRRELFDTDGRINRAVQNLRRELVVHVAVHGTAEVSSALLLMSVLKDAERIGDYAKNVFDLTAHRACLSRDAEGARDLAELRDRILQALAETKKVFDTQNQAEARAITRRLAAIEDHCDARVEELLRNQERHPCPATLVLAYRYFKRIASHTMNVATTIFMPLDKIDFFDEKQRPPDRR